MNGLRRRACPVVIAAPSGTGKTTIARALVASDGSFRFSVSATTRAPRPGERPGVDYHFVSRPEFEAMVAGGDFAEWAEVHGELYGTPHRELDRAAERAVHAVLDIDVQGARQIRTAVPDAVLVFLVPPSGKVLLSRLQERGTEDPDEVRTRLTTALEELNAAQEFDYVVVNDELERAVADVRSIARAERLRVTRTEGLPDIVQEIRAAIARHGQRSAPQAG